MGAAASTISVIAPRIIIPGFFIGQQVKRGGSWDTIAVSSAFTILFITSVVTAFSASPALSIIPSIACLAYSQIMANPEDADRWRHSDWLLTTPLMLFALLYACDVPVSVILPMVACDILMILAGYLGTKTKNPLESKGYFAIGILAFLPIVAILLQQTKNKMAVYLTLVVWSLYPVVYFAQENKLVEKKYTTIAYSFMDVIAKTGLVYLIHI
jgi:Bacteriorhodopsin-like protein